MSDFGYIKRNLEELTEEIEELSAQSGQRVTTVCVTKSGTDDELLALCEAGARCIGENRPQELKRRGELLFAQGFSPELHQIGSLQRNKVKYVIDKAALIHSVDTEKLAVEISRLASLRGIEARVLIEVNSAREAAKGGVLPENTEALFEKLLALPSIKVCGLMTMGPPLEDAEELRPYFRQTRELFLRLDKAYGFGGEGVLSMGMSDSYRVAIEEGSTLVRVGRRLFRK